VEQSNKIPWGLITIATILFAFFHRFLVADVLAPTGSWQAKKSQTLEPTPGSFPLEENGVFFVNNGNVGYLTEDGRLTYYNAHEGILSGTDSEILVSNPTKKTQEWISRNQKIQLNSSDQIMVAGQLKLVLQEDYLGFKVVSLDGKTNWTRVRSAPITSLSQNSQLLAVGDAAGLVEIYDNLGNIISTFRPGGSRYEVIYQVAVSPNGQRVLVLSGLEPKRLIVLEKGVDDYKPIQHERVEDQRRFSTELRWLNDEHFLFSDLDGQRLQLRKILSDWKILVDAKGEVLLAEQLENLNEVLIALYYQESLNFFIFTYQGENKVFVSTLASVPWFVRFQDRFYFIRDGQLKSFVRGQI